MIRKYAVWCLILALGACKGNTMYQGKHDFVDQQWSPEEMVEFTFEVEDASQPYDVFYQVRHTRDYPYQNLYVRVAVEDSVRQVLQSELQNIVLFDPKTGEPEGSGSGSRLSREVRGLKSFSFPGPGNYTVRLEQRNRDGVAESLDSFGIWLTPSKQNK